jgi:hypothetical protein
LSAKNSKTSFYVVLSGGLAIVCVLTFGYISWFEYNKTDFALREELSWRQLYSLKGILYQQSDDERNAAIIASLPPVPVPTKINKQSLLQPTSIIATTSISTSSSAINLYTSENIAQMPALKVEAIQSPLHSLHPLSASLSTQPFIAEDPAVYQSITSKRSIKTIEFGALTALHSSPNFRFLPSFDQISFTKNSTPYHLKTTSKVLGTSTFATSSFGAYAGYHLHPRLAVFSGIQFGFIDGEMSEELHTITYDPANAPAFILDGNFQPGKPIGVEGITTDEYLLERKDTLHRSFRMSYLEVPLYVRTSLLRISDFYWIAEVGFSARFNVKINEQAEDVNGEIHTSQTGNSQMESLRSRLSTGIEYRNYNGWIIQLQPEIGIHLLDLQKTVERLPLSRDNFGLRLVAGYRF